jgi:hypothetical protein
LTDLKGKVSMNNYKKEILDKICYTELVYRRINKKLNINLSKDKIEELILAVISETNEANFKKMAKIFTLQTTKEMLD